MAKKAKEKQESLHTMSVKELDAKLQEALATKFQLAFRHATAPLKNPMQLRQTRRSIARLKTLIRQKSGSN